MLVQDRNYQRAVEVLVATRAIDSDPLQAAAQLGAGDAILLRQSQAQRAVGKAQAKGDDRLRLVDAAGLQIRERLGTLFQGLVVVVDDLVEQRLVVGLARHRCGQAAHGRVLHRDGVSS